jgi:hypothetical protein
LGFATPAILGIDSHGILVSFSEKETKQKTKNQKNTRPQDKIGFFPKKTQLNPHSKKTFGQPWVGRHCDAAGTVPYWDRLRREITRAIQLL